MSFAIAETFLIETPQLLMLAHRSDSDKYIDITKLL
jgi:hypothetical protein